jgi:sugar/nucleoside kinase (ribokinase family)
MPLLVTGSVAIDTVKTPFGVSENCLGGSAVYFSMAASFFSSVRLVAVVGPDCPFDLTKTFAGKDIDLQGVEVRAGSKTFRWAGSYHGPMSEAITDKVELNVLAEHPPQVPAGYKNSRYVFLANTAPALQQKLLEQIDKPAFVAADTMNCWIQNHPEDLKKLLQEIDALVLNNSEARQLTGEANLTKAAERILQMGPGVVIIKKGEHGSMMCDKDGASFHLPGFPTGKVKDPTGAGDSFAGALMGCLAEQDKADHQTLKKAIAYGTVTASFAVEDFSTQRLASITRTDIDKRFEALKKLTQF